MKLAADDVQTVVLRGSGHWVAEQAPDELLATLTAFLAPYREGEQRVSDDAQGTDGIQTAIEDPSIGSEGEPNV